MDIFLNTLTSIILAKYFAKLDCVFLITDNYNEINLNTTLPIVNLKIDNNKLQIDIFRNGFGCFGFVLKSQTPCELFRNIEYSIKHTYEKFNERKYLVLPSNGFVLKNFTCLFDLEELEFVDDLLLILPSTSLESNDTNSLSEYLQTYDLITHKYVGDVHNERVLLDKWYAGNETFLYNNDLYPHKLRNQHGRTLRVACFTYPPYSVPEILDGSELRLINLFSELYNTSTELIIDEAGQWGTIYDNWTGNGVVGNVAKDEADIGLAALYTWQRESLFLDLSKSFVRTGITCLTPSPRLADGWLTPVLAFSNRLWIAVGIMFILVILSFFLTIIILKKYKLDGHYLNKNDGTLIEQSIFLTLSIFFMQSVPFKQIPKDKLFACIFGMVLIIGVLLTTCYSSGLSSNMTVPRYIGEIKTVRDLIDSNLNWGATDVAWIASIINDTDGDISTLVNRFRILSENKLNRNAQTNEFAFSIERLSGGNYAIGGYIGKREIEHLTPMREDIYYEHCVFMLKKSSILLTLLDDLILKIFEAGLLKYWEYQVVIETMDTYVQRVVRYSFHQKDSSNEPTQLKLNHLAGGFSVLIVGLTLSFVIFLFEYFGNKL